MARTEKPDARANRLATQVLTRLRTHATCDIVGVEYDFTEICTVSELRFLAARAVRPAELKPKRKKAR